MWPYMEFFSGVALPLPLWGLKGVIASSSDCPHTHLAHKLVHALSPLQNQVVLGREGVVLSSTFHPVEVLPVFYLKDTHKEGPELLSSCSMAELTLKLPHT